MAAAMENRVTVTASTYTIFIVVENNMIEIGSKSILKPSIGARF
jgi:hypothetical protein